jgi:hypothetical protein
MFADAGVSHCIAGEGPSWHVPARSQQAQLRDIALCPARRDLFSVANTP